MARTTNRPAGWTSSPTRSMQPRNARSRRSGASKVSRARGQRRWTLLLLIAVGSLLDGDAVPFPTTLPVAETTALDTRSVGGFNDLYTGTIPTELGLLTKVTKADLEHYCEFIGPLPTELGTLSMMHDYFYVQSNALTSTLPTQLGGAFADMSEWQGFDVSLNWLTGPIPTQYGSMTKIDAFYASANKLTGRVPSELGLMAWVQDVLLFTNSLSATLPTQLGQLTKISGDTDPSFSGGGQGGLDLKNNDFTSAVPTELGRLTNLKQRLRLNANEFSSTIPSELGLLTATTYVGMSYNGFTGAIPTQIGSMMAIEALYLPHNALCNDIPTQVAALSTALPSYTTTEWNIDSGNALGTPCCEAYPEHNHTCAP
eukprot:CAMPEP_0119474374 /NCGR_PEP_ID=MMETSP1344-20130328/5647_1 /TAXON_ID=236787 /ORGANISM="Florenciella parvula, Strain CCMP2471" /LENGTH=370 /DNA_ID=CAMNT_0007507645 /DNA_START=629 /DNA_END=1737 /DNA_ORIENTATION=+